MSLLINFLAIVILIRPSFKYENENGQTISEMATEVLTIIHTNL